VICPCSRSITHTNERIDRSIGNASYRLDPSRLFFFVSTWTGGYAPAKDLVHGLVRDPAPPDRVRLAHAARSLATTCTASSRTRATAASRPHVLEYYQKHMFLMLVTNCKIIENLQN
jgi:hypothetical protein